MTDEANKSRRTSIQQMAIMLGFPEPEPFTEEEERAFQEKMDRIDAEARAMIDRRRERPAA